MEWKIRKVIENRSYVGSELDLFARATNWKSYWLKKISPFLQGNVLEVGAGNGANASFILPSAKNITRWLCLEPDQRLAGQIRDRKLKSSNGRDIEVINSTLADLSKQEPFQTILYIDVLEHIMDDKSELQQAERLLAQGGRLIILGPAHNELFSEFDKSVGHFRRYNRDSLKRVVPKTLKKISLYYLDSCGLFASLANRWVLSQGMPSTRQILFWDKVLVTASRALDPASDYCFGKSILGIWEKRA